VILIGAASCDTDDDEPELGVFPGPAVTMTSYPLAVGNHWWYEIDVIVTGDYAESSIINCEFTVVSDSVVNGEPVKGLRSQQSEGQNIYHGTRWMAHTDSGLVRLAVQGSGGSMYLKPYLDEDPSFFSEFSSYGIFGKTDSVLILPNPIFMMKFPASIGASWFSNEFSPIAMFKRRWAGFNTVVTEAGNFDCIRLELFPDTNMDDEPDADFTITQYISPEYGIVMEVLNKDLLFGNGETGHLYREARLVQKNF